MEEIPEPLVPIACLPDLERIHELGLVVLSQQAPYWVEATSDGYVLWVEGQHAEELQRQLELYDRESVNWPPRSPEIAEGEAGFLAPVGWMLLLFFSYGLSLQYPQLYELGRLSARAVMEGEAYRVLTALFLHADFGHLMGNLVFGAIFLHLVSRFCGGLRAFLGILLSGVLGNLLNAWLYYPEDHFSIGASTAVFGAIGILVAFPGGAFIRYSGFRIARIWTLPLVAGLVFLAWFGTGDAQTDTSAHLLGFASGLPLGLVLGLLARRPR